MERRGQLRWLARIALTAAVLCSAGVLRAEKWVRVSGPKVVIYTGQLPADAREWVIGLEAFRQHQRDLFNVNDDALELLQMVLFPDERSFRSVLEAGAPTGVGGGWAAVTRFNNRDGRSYGSISPADPSAARYGAFLNSTLWLTSSYRRPLPLWVTAGFEELYASFYVENDRVLIGARVDDDATALKEGLRVPVADMLAMRTTDRAYTSMKNVGNFNAQAWACVHYLLYGEKGARRAAFQRYIAELQAGRTNEEAFAEAFPEGVADLSKRLERYVKQADYRPEKLPMKVSEIMKTITTSTPSAADVQLALGYAHLYTRGPDVAGEYFQRAASLAPDTAPVLEAQADLALARGDDALAEEKLQAAVKAGSTYYLAHLLPALRQAALAKGLEQAADRPDAELARKTIDELKAALRLRPAQESACETLGGLIGAVAEVNDDDLHLLEESRGRYPNHVWIQTGYAAYQMKKKRFADAKAALDEMRAGEWVGSAGASDYAQKIEQRLQAMVNFYLLQRHLAEEHPDKAMPLVAKLQEAPLLPEERVVVNQANGLAAGFESLARVREAIAAEDWEGAEAFLGDVTGAYVPDRIRIEGEKLAALVAAKKKS